LNSEFYDKYSKVINKAVIPIQVNWVRQKKNNIQTKNLDLHLHTK